MKKIVETRKAPSRLRYEQGHPTVSCRISREIYDRLRKTKETDGKSFADILKIGLGIIEAQAKKEPDVTKQGYTRGYRKGYADAESAFKITFPCNIYRKIMTVTGQNEKEIIRGYLRKDGWGHAECHTWRVS